MKKTSEPERVVDAIEIDANEALILLLLVMLQMIRVVHLDPCGC